MKKMKTLAISFVGLFFVIGCTFFTNYSGTYYFDSVIMIEDGQEVTYDCSESVAQDENSAVYQVCQFYSSVHLILREDKLFMGIENYEEEEIGLYKIENGMMYTRPTVDDDWVEYGEYKDRTIIKNDYTFKTVFKY